MKTTPLTRVAAGGALILAFCSTVIACSDSTSSSTSSTSSSSGGENLPNPFDPSQIDAATSTQGGDICSVINPKSPEECVEFGAAQCQNGTFRNTVVQNHLTLNDYACRRGDDVIGICVTKDQGTVIHYVDHDAGKYAPMEADFERSCVGPYEGTWTPGPASTASDGGSDAADAADARG